MRMMLALTLASLCLTTEAAAQHGPPPSATEVRTGRTAVLERLRDPESARFRYVVTRRLENGTRLFCGEVNSRNAFGGYVGYRRFFALGDFALVETEGDDLRAAQFYHYDAQLCDPANAALPAAF